jgi:hypothetical protein
MFKSLARDLPVIVSFVGETMEADTRRSFREAGVLLAPDPSVTMQALGLLYERHRARSLPRLRPREAMPTRPAPRTWAEIMRFCEDGGIAPAPWVVLQPGQSAGQGCAALKYPLVVKVLPSDSEHKTELGLVRLRVQTPEEVDRLAAEFRQRLGKPDAGILVQQMVGDGVEVVVSCLRNTDFGPVLSIGSGGVGIELYRDIVHMALPVTAGQVAAALRTLKLSKLLEGFRGKPAADVDALVEAAVRFGDAFLACPDVTEFEINPVIVAPRGQGLLAVDALVTSRPSPAGAPAAITSREGTPA